MINEQTQIGKLRIHALTGAGSGASEILTNTAACRQSISSQLANTSFKPDHMSPSSILVVRKMTDPIAGRLSTNTQRYLPDREWQNAVNYRLNKLYQSAKKTNKGVVDADAEAVVFADAAELLACYVSDLVNHRSGLNWWWKTVIKYKFYNDNLSAALREIFIDEIKCLPAILVKLHRWHVAAPVIELLETSDALFLCLHLAKHYELIELTGLINDRLILSDKKVIKTQYAEPALDKTGESDKQYVGNESTDNRHLRLQAYFRRNHSVDIKPQGTTLEQVLLSALGIVLHQQPWQARSSVFQYQLIQFFKDFCEKQSDEDDKKSDTINDSVLIYDPDLQDKQEIDFFNMPDVSAGSLEDKNTDVLTEIIAQDSNTPVNIIEKLSDKIITMDTDENLTGRMKTVYSEQGITTELGGILYLLNLVNMLDMTGCFENYIKSVSDLKSDEVKTQQPDLIMAVLQQKNSAISPWLLLEVMAKTLLDETLPECKDDDIWSLLHELYGKAITDTVLRQAVQQLEESQFDYQLPESWFDIVYNEHETYCWADNNYRLYVWSASGYLLTDINRNNKVAFAQASDVLHFYLGENRSNLLVNDTVKNLPVDTSLLHHAELYPQLYASGLYSALIHWMSFVMPFIRYQLQLASGVNAQDLAKQLLFCRGQIFLSSTHLDLQSSLQGISITARRAGIDRDPGWLPEVGRVVSFHFD